MYYYHDKIFFFEEEGPRCKKIIHHWVIPAQWWSVLETRSILLQLPQNGQFRFANKKCPTCLHVGLFRFQGEVLPSRVKVPDCVSSLNAVL
jgi:hypothetical protein